MDERALMAHASPQSDVTDDKRPQPYSSELVDMYVRTFIFMPDP